MLGIEWRASVWESREERETNKQKNFFLACQMTTWNPSIVRLHCSTHCPSPSIAEGLIQHWSAHDAVMVELWYGEVARIVYSLQVHCWITWCPTTWQILKRKLCSSTWKVTICNRWWCLMWFTGEICMECCRVKLHHALLLFFLPMDPNVKTANIKTLDEY